MAAASPEAIIWACAAGVSAGCAGYLLVGSLQAARAQARHLRALGQPAKSTAFKLLRPVGRSLGFLLGGASARMEMAMGREAEKSFLLPARIWAEKRLRAAAHPEGVTAQEFLGIMVVGAVMGTLMGVLANTWLHFGPIVLLFAGGGLYWPVLWIRKRVRQRQDDIRRGLPYGLDLLTLSVEVGLDFTEALARIVQKLGSSALAVEFGQTLRDIQLGRTRAQALRDLSRRVDLPELNSLVSALIQADELGSSLGPILRVQSEQLRTRRSQQAEKLAMQAPVKILLPLIFFIFPCIFIMIFGPIILRELH